MSVIARSVAALALAAAAVVTLPGQASAADPCWRDGIDWYCNHDTNINVYDRTNTNRIVGQIAGDTSFFICRYDLGQNHGGDNPTRWSFTIADNIKWGWVRDIDIVSDTDVLPHC